MIGLAEVDDQKKNLLITKHNIICCRDGDKHSVAIPTVTW